MFAEKMIKKGGREYTPQGLPNSGEVLLNKNALEVFEMIVWNYCFCVKALEPAFLSDISPYFQISTNIC